MSWSFDNGIMTARWKWGEISIEQRENIPHDSDGFVFVGMHIDGFTIRGVFMATTDPAHSVLCYGDTYITCEIPFSELKSARPDLCTPVLRVP